MLAWNEGKISGKHIYIPRAEHLFNTGEFDFYPLSIGLNNEAMGMNEMYLNVSPTISSYI